MATYRRPTTIPEGYDVAQICLNGHVTNSSTIGTPEHNEKFCRKCGAETITACPDCDCSIRGYLWGAGIGGGYDPPSFCTNCGNPFPWTQARINAASELAKELDSLDDEDRIVLQNSIDDMVRDTPSTNVAVLRFKRIMLKVGQDVAGIFREILVDVLSETAKKALWP